MTDRANGINGICLRGKAGWGENMAFLTAMSNSFGARWFDEKWKPQFDQPEWKNTLQFYVDLMKDAGPPGASSNGFNENLALFQQGKCGMWIDATVAASFVTDPKNSRSPTRSASRWRRTTASASAATGCGPGRSPSRPARRRPKRPRSSSSWATSKALYRARRLEGRLGQRSSRHAHLALRQCRIPEGGALRQDDAGLDQRRRPDAIRPSSRCPMSACSSSPSLSSRASAPPSASCSRRRLPARSTVDDALKQAQDAADRDNDQGRLHQVRLLPVPEPVALWPHRPPSQSGRPPSQPGIRASSEPVPTCRVSTPWLLDRHSIACRASCWRLRCVAAVRSG